MTIGIALRRRQTLAWLALLPAARPAVAQRPGVLRIVVPFPPGGSTDAAARILAEALAVELKQTVIVDNKPGAGTTLAAAFVAASAADGNTVLLTGPISHVVSGLLYPRLKYDALQGFAPVGQLATAPFLVVVRAASPHRTLDDLVRAAKAVPGNLSYGSSGIGASPHLVAEMLASQAGVKFLHVPYKGAGPATVGLMAEEVDFSVSDASAIPHVASGRLRALAVTTARRSALLPDVPTVAEATGLEIDEASGIVLLAPAATPRPVIEQLFGAMAKAAAQDGMARRLATQGMEVAVTTGAHLRAAMDAMSMRHGRLIQRLQLRLE